MESMGAAAEEKSFSLLVSGDFNVTGKEKNSGPRQATPFSLLVSGDFNVTHSFVNWRDDNVQLSVS